MRVSKLLYLIIYEESQNNDISKAVNAWSCSCLTITCFRYRCMDLDLKVREESCQFMRWFQ